MQLTKNGLLIILAKVCFNEKQIEFITRVLYDWLNDGFTTPPYSDEAYDVIEELKIENEYVVSYDIERPKVK